MLYGLQWSVALLILENASNQITYYIAFSLLKDLLILGSIKILHIIKSIVLRELGTQVIFIFVRNIIILVHIDSKIFFCGVVLLAEFTRDEFNGEGIIFQIEEVSYKY